MLKTRRVIVCAAVALVLGIAGFALNSYSPTPCEVTKVTTCTTCKGTGNSSFTCKPCKGTGKNGKFQCTHCKGSGWQRCSTCKGSGVSPK